MPRLTSPTRAAFEASFYRRLKLTRAEADALYDSLAHPLPATTELLIVHDQNDRMLSATNSELLHAAHPHSRLLLTRNLGHNRILGADEVLDAVLAFATGPRLRAAARGTAERPVA